jgi:hypothetical protein
MSTYKQNNQSVQTQFNIGRDQVIHNLVVVGQFLDFAKVEGLLPKSETPSDFSTIVEAFEETFVQRLGSDLTQATAHAGIILSDVMLKYIPKQLPAALPIKTILREAPHSIYLKLSKFGYWDAFYEVTQGYGNDYQVVWLYSLGLLWEKHFGHHRLFGILKRPSTALLCEAREGKKEIAGNVNIDDITYDKFRVIMAGLTVDLIRICSIASTDLQFWEGIISLLNIDRQGSK